MRLKAIEMVVLICMTTIEIIDVAARLGLVGWLATAAGHWPPITPRPWG
jgi:hypothetical protein